GGNAVPLRGAPRRRHAGGRRPGPPDTGTSPLRLPGRLRTRERTSRRALPTGPRRPPLVPVRLGPGPGGLEELPGRPDVGRATHRHALPAPGGRTRRGDLRGRGPRRRGV